MHVLVNVSPEDACRGHTVSSGRWQSPAPSSTLLGAPRLWIFNPPHFLHTFQRVGQRHTSNLPVGLCGGALGHQAQLRQGGARRARGVDQAVRSAVIDPTVLVDLVLDPVLSVDVLMYYIYKRSAY